MPKKTIKLITNPLRDSNNGAESLGRIVSILPHMGADWLNELAQSLECSFIGAKPEEITVDENGTATLTVKG